MFGYNLQGLIDKLHGLDDKLQGLDDKLKDWKK